MSPGPGCGTTVLAGGGSLGPFVVPAPGVSDGGRSCVTVGTGVEVGSGGLEGPGAMSAVHAEPKIPATDNTIAVNRRRTLGLFIQPSPVF